MPAKKKQPEPEVLRAAKPHTVNVEIDGTVVELVFHGSPPIDAAKALIYPKDDEAAIEMLQAVAFDETTKGLVPVMPERYFVALQLQARYNQRLTEVGRAFTDPKAS